MATDSVLCDGAVVLYIHGTAYFLMIWALARLLAQCGDVFGLVCRFSQNAKYLTGLLYLDNQRLRLGPKRVGIFTIESFSFCWDKKKKMTRWYFLNWWILVLSWAGAQCGGWLAGWLSLIHI